MCWSELFQWIWFFSFFSYIVWMRMSWQKMIERNAWFPQSFSRVFFKYYTIIIIFFLLFKINQLAFLKWDFCRFCIRFQMTWCCMPWKIGAWIMSHNHNHQHYNVEYCCLWIDIYFIMILIYMFDVNGREIEI